MSRPKSAREIGNGIISTNSAILLSLLSRLEERAKMAIPPPPTEVPQIRDASIRSVKVALAAVGFELDSDAESAITERIKHGKERMASEVRVQAISTDDSNEAALQNLRTLIQEMANRATENGTRVIDMVALTSSLRKLCPIAPWCK